MELQDAPRQVVPLDLNTQLTSAPVESQNGSPLDAAAMLASRQTAPPNGQASGSRGVPLSSLVSAADKPTHSSSQETRQTHDPFGLGDQGSRILFGQGSGTPWEDEFSRLVEGAAAGVGQLGTEALDQFAWLTE